MAEDTKTPTTLSDIKDRALALHRSGALDEAKHLYQTYLQNAPRDHTMWSNLGALFRSEKNYEIAALCQRRAVAHAPQVESVANNAANALYDAGYAEEALALRQKILAAEPGKAEHYSGLGKYLRALGRHEEAIAEMSKALRVHTDDPEIHLQLAFAQLSTGDYPAGFETFHWRWKGDEISPPDLDLPQWQGEDLKGKTILVTPEQGFGDTILMARFLPQLKALGCQVKLSCKQPLLRVFENLAGVDAFCSTIDEISDCDYWTPLMDLPRWLGTTLETVPAPVTLAIPEDSIERAQHITAPYQNNFKVGVLWSGSVTYRANHKRSFDHTQFVGLADIENLQMFSLYKGPLLDRFQADGSSFIIIDAAGNDRDFADSAALINELDLVITMDSAIAHVSGSLGVNVWNLLHSEAYWLYEPFEDHTPWYPSMRLIRQTKSGDWGPVFDQLRTELSQLAKDKKSK